MVQRDFFSFCTGLRLIELKAIGLLSKVRAGVSTRFLVRELLLILLLARLDLSQEPVFYAAIACFTLPTKKSSSRTGASSPT